MSRSEMDTTDAELAHEWIRRTYAGRAPQVTGSREGFRTRVASAETDLFRVDDLLHTVSVRVDHEPFDRVIVVRLRAGHYRTDGPDTSLTSDAGRAVMMMDPDRPGRTSWDTVDEQIVALDHDATRAVVADLGDLPADQVRFSLSEPLDAVRARYWERTVDHVAGQVLADDALAAEPLVRAEAFRALAWVAATTFPNTALAAQLDPARPPPGWAEPAAVRRAVEYVDAHAAEDVGLSDIAAAARLGPRGLQAAFRRHRGQTPTDYLRQVRLDHAHRDLRAGDATRGDTVAAIAARWGFAHAGRFSARYRATYGCPPGHTLRR